MILNSSFCVAISLLRFSDRIYCSNSSFSSFLITCSCAEYLLSFSRIGMSYCVRSFVNQDRFKSSFTPVEMIAEVSMKKGEAGDMLKSTNKDQR